uniref:Uncharacterized protein n=1 Tax=Ditylenchus dipsaci TaxID=166011 RepID=A0A915DFT6_9BILA
MTFSVSIAMFFQVRSLMYAIEAGCNLQVGSETPVLHIRKVVVNSDMCSAVTYVTVSDRRDEVAVVVQVNVQSAMYATFFDLYDKCLIPKQSGREIFASTVLAKDTKFGTVLRSASSAKNKFVTSVVVSRRFLGQIGRPISSLRKLALYQLENALARTYTEGSRMQSQTMRSSFFEEVASTVDAASVMTLRCRIAEGKWLGVDEISKSLAQIYRENTGENQNLWNITEAVKKFQEALRRGLGRDELSCKSVKVLAKKLDICDASWAPYRHTLGLHVYRSWSKLPKGVKHENYQNYNVTFNPMLGCSERPGGRSWTSGEILSNAMEELQNKLEEISYAQSEFSKEQTQQLEHLKDLNSRMEKVESFKDREEDSKKRRSVILTPFRSGSVYVNADLSKNARKKRKQKLVEKEDAYLNRILKKRHLMITNVDGDNTDPQKHRIQMLQKSHEHCPTKCQLLL